MLESALIGPQLVSPNTRRPTSMSGSERMIAAIAIHTGMPSDHCTHTTSTELRIEPITTQLIGKSPGSISAPESCLNVLMSSFQRSTSAVSPPATSMPVAGHITHSSTWRRTK